jgi:hypothetical protein
MDHSFLSTFKVKCHLTFYKILFALFGFLGFFLLLLLLLSFTDLKTSLNNFIPVHLTVISPHHRRLCFYFWTFVCSNSDILKRHESLLPVYFQGQMSSDFLQDLICTCNGKAVCSSGCVCFEQGLSCTNMLTLFLICSSFCPQL